MNERTALGIHNIFSSFASQHHRECISYFPHPFISFRLIRWGGKGRKKNSVISSIENWYLIPIIKINWHFSSTYCFCICCSHFLSFRFPHRIDIAIYQLQLQADKKTVGKKSWKNFFFFSFFLSFCKSSPPWFFRKLYTFLINRSFS